MSDFESAGDLKKWKNRESILEQSSDHATEGSHSGKAIFFGGVQTSNVMMEDFLEDNPQFGNWAGFNQLKFDVYNAGGDSERLILKIKDSNDRAWQRNITVAPGQNTEVKIYIEELKGSIDPSRIRQFNLFRWQPANEAAFYLDNLRLIPEGATEKTGGPAETRKETKSDTQIAGANKFLFDAQNIAFGLGTETSIERVFLEPNKFRGKPTDAVEISMARNEYESAQAVIYAKEGIEKVSIEKSDLTADIAGKTFKIDKSNIRCYHVGYVKTRKPGYSVSYVGWWPDPLEEKPFFHIKENTLQPIWIEVYAPEDLPTGEYTGNITVKFGDSKSKDIKLKVKVWDFALPEETHLKTAFDFYYGRMKRMYPQKEGEDAEGYGARLSELQMKYYIDMIKHRIMPIFNFDIEDAFFAKDIKVYLKNGLSAFAIGQYGGSFDNNWPKDPGGLEKLTEVYREYARVLKAAGLMDKAYIYTYDEPKYGEPHVDEVTKMIHKADLNLKNMVCLSSLSNPDKYPGWGDDIDIWCVRNVVFNEKMADVYKKKGKDIWLYVSGPEPPYPTLVIDYPAMAYRIIPWQCWKYGIKGYLYWCVNFWNENPWQNPMNTKWEQNGNGLLYYPGEKGPVTSIRLEVTRDGLEDYEYLYLLEQRIKEIETKGRGSTNSAILAKAKRLLNIDSSIVESMSDYTKDAETIYNRRRDIAETIEALDKILATQAQPAKTTTQEKKDVQAVEDFSKPIEVASGKSFGDYGQLTFELYRGGTFIIDKNPGFALQRSDNYRDVALIRSTNPLPKTYKVSAVVGDIDYDLSKIEGLRPDTEYAEGPMDENGCYLLAITDEAPTGHHTNDWWHQHRKVCIDVDNNVWGTGMPHPIFMVYFDKKNKLVSFSGKFGRWQGNWARAIMYEPHKWYKVEIKKTENEFILSVYDDKGSLLKTGTIELGNIWNEDGKHPDYLVIGDPHENYYQGSLKIKAISVPVVTDEKA